jgi:hypothetical protein
MLSFIDCAVGCSAVILILSSMLKIAGWGMDSNMLSFIDCAFGCSFVILILSRMLKITDYRLFEGSCLK